MHRSATLPPFERRTAALALTALVHVLLVLGWQATRRPALPAPARDDGKRIQWITLPPAVRTAPAAPRASASARAQTPVRERAREAPAATPSAITIVPAAPAPIASPSTAPAETPNAPAAPSSPEAPATATSGPDSLLQRARRGAGAADRALRKDGTPLILAPPDTPMARLRSGIEAAADAAPTRWYEAPKIDELTNYTGDGERITRVRSGGNTYCVFTRSPTASIDAIEKQGKERIGRCPPDATPAHKQAWRTSRGTGLE